MTVLKSYAKKLILKERLQSLGKMKLWGQRIDGIVIITAATA